MFVPEETKSNLNSVYALSPEFDNEKAVLGLKEFIPIALSSKIGIVVLTVATIVNNASTLGATS